ncbi:MAG: Heme/hemopexin-binding protein [Chlamydiae bacterium]|nr:Heme/hemopexin-binding protein [Chlamydiota bacterium]
MTRFVLCLLLIPALLLAKPKGAEVVSGHALVKERGSLVEIHTSDRAIVKWDEFSIQKGETARFIQPNSNSAILNRVNSGVSHIDGLLEANGKVFLFNPRGVVIGKGGEVICGGFVATTLDLDDGAFLKNGDLLFKGSSQSKIVNMGRIEALGGDVFLLARAVLNEGTIHAPDGVAGIAAASEVLLKPEGMQRLYISPSNEVIKGGVENEGIIEAARAELRADGNVFRLAINQTGVVEAKGTKEIDGRVFLVAEGGSALNTGDVRAQNNDQTGGAVHLLGEHVGVVKGGTIDVSGDFGGGEVLIGGDFQGKNPEISNASITLVERNAQVRADAKISGNGGRVIVWSDGPTSMRGAISAEGGAKSGDGGFVEVSGLTSLQCSGSVSTRAPNGKTGDLLLDPSDVIIDSFGGNTGITFDAAIGEFIPTAAVAELDNGAGTGLSGTLDSFMGGNNVTVTTTTAFGSAGDITLKDAVTWSSDNSLTLVADRDILLTGGEVSTIGSGSVTLIAGRDVTMEDSFEGISTTTGDLSVLAGRGVTVHPDSFDIECIIKNGNVTFEAGGDIEIGNPGSGNLSFKLETETGFTSFSVEGDLKLDNSDGAASSSLEILLGELGGSFKVGGDLLLQGGAEGGTPVVISNASTTIGTTTFEVEGNVSILGGGGMDSFVQIGVHPLAQGLTSGNLLFPFVGGNLLVQGGLGDSADAGIGHSIRSSDIQVGVELEGDVTFERIGGNVTIEGKGGDALIGYRVMGIDPIFQGSITVNALGQTTLTASAGHAAIGYLFSVGSSTVNASQIFLSTDSLRITAGDGLNAFVGSYPNATDPDLTIDKVFVETRGDITLIGGKKNFGSDGAAAIGIFSDNSTRGNVFVHSGGDIFLEGSSGGVNGFAIIGNSNNVSTSEVVIEARNIILGKEMANLQSARFTSSGSITAIADCDMFLRDAAFIRSRNVTLVVDNDKPDSPDRGKGRFVLASDAILSATGDLRIFTVQPTQNSITGDVNGSPFVQAPFLVNTDDQRWATYFLDSYANDPFVVFYKLGLPNFQNAYGIAISEMLKNLKIYDELFFEPKCFLFGYDKACYDRLFYPSGMISSFDLIGDEEFVMLRPKYRNYHTKYELF